MTIAVQATLSGQAYVNTSGAAQLVAIIGTYSSALYTPSGGTGRAITGDVVLLQNGDSVVVTNDPLNPQVFTLVVVT